MSRVLQPYQTREEKSVNRIEKAEETKWTLLLKVQSTYQIGPHYNLSGYKKTQSYTSVCPFDNPAAPVASVVAVVPVPNVVVTAPVCVVAVSTWVPAVAASLLPVSTWVPAVAASLLPREG